MAYKSINLDKDQDLRRSRDWHHDPDSGQTVITTVYDTTEIEEQNKALYAGVDERANWKGDWHKVASVPLAVWWDWMQKTNYGKDTVALKKLLNDPDNRSWRTRPGRV